MTLAVNVGPEEFNRDLGRLSKIDLTYRYSSTRAVIDRVRNVPMRRLHRWSGGILQGASVERAKPDRIGSTLWLVLSYIWSRPGCRHS